MAEYKILKGWELEMNTFHLLHEKSSEYYSRLNFYFMIPIIILSSSTGTLGLLNASEPQFTFVNDVNIIGIFIGIFGFVTAILTTIHNFLNIQKLESNHNNHAVEYSKISKEIKMQIYLSDTDVKVYSNIAEYIKECKQKIDKLIESAPPIPSNIENILDSKLKEIRNNNTGEIDELISLVTHNCNDKVYKRSQTMPNDIKLTIMDTIDLNETSKYSKRLSEDKYEMIEQRMSEINNNQYEKIERTENEEEKRNSEDSNSTDEGRMSMDFLNKIKKDAEMEEFKETST